MPLLTTVGALSAKGYGATIGRKAPPVPPTPGQLYEGGYYFGTINDGGVLYELIISPLPDGQTVLPYSSSGTLGPTTPYSLTNGFANTELNVTSARPANQWVRSLNINGYTDWYIAARDEMELMYRNLKPTTTANLTGNRAYGTQQGDTIITQGSNVNSVPVGAAYTASNPGMTSIAIFQQGGSQALQPNVANYNMITSTRFMGANNTMLYQNMNNGQQATATNIIGNQVVRAIRRKLRPNY